MRALALLLVLLAGCSNSAERRLLIIHEAKLVLRHSCTDADWAARRAIIDAHIQEEDPDAR